MTSPISSRCECNIRCVALSSSHQPTRCRVPSRSNTPPRRFLPAGGPLVARACDNAEVDRVDAKPLGAPSNEHHAHTAEAAATCEKCFDVKLPLHRAVLPAHARRTEPEKEAIALSLVNKRISLEMQRCPETHHRGVVLAAHRVDRSTSRTSDAASLERLKLASRVRFVSVHGLFYEEKWVRPSMRMTRRLFYRRSLVLACARTPKSLKRREVIACATLAPSVVPRLDVVRMRLETKH